MTADAVETFDVAGLLRFSETALAALGAAREEIDALNVYPVPDADTGTNLFLTFEAGHNAMSEVLEDVSGLGSDDRLRLALSGFARGCLLAARGNSGVIFSQLAGAMARHLAEASPAESPAVVFARALVRATEAGYAAVGAPVEGTILSVAGAASRAAADAAGEGDPQLGHVVRAAAAAARAALTRTPDQLAVLEEAGVVDAGGRGLCVILDAAETVVTGRRPVGDAAGFGARTIPVPARPTDPGASGVSPRHEVMYLLDASDEQIPDLRRRLSAVGDSLVVVGGDGLWNVHVHIDDVGAAIEAGIEAGRPHRVRVTELVDRLGHGTHHQRAQQRTGRRVVVVAAGEGLIKLFAEAGAGVVQAEPGRRPSAGQIVDAVTATEAAEVIVLPNDRGSIAAAEAAASACREDGAVEVAVIATRAQVQGLAALAVHEPGRAFEQDVLEMTAAARHARSGAVTVATEPAMTTAGPCRPGDALGEIEGDFVLVGDDPLSVSIAVLDRLLGGGGELVTIVAGAGPDAAALAERCAAHVARAHPMVDVVVYEGGQERYPLLVGVE